MSSAGKRGLFITLEGTEGVGKTTNIETIKSWLEARSINYIATREPGGTPLAEELRNLLLSPREELVDNTAELLMIFAARAQHLNTVIKPALEQGITVLCDRFTDATYAYQGYGRGLSLDLIENLERQVQGDLHPDMTILLDIDVEVGLARAAQRAELDRFEKEQKEFFEMVRAGYSARVKQCPHRYCVIDASKSLEEVKADVQSSLNEWFSRSDKSLDPR